MAFQHNMTLVLAMLSMISVEAFVPTTMGNFGRSVSPSRMMRRQEYYEEEEQLYYRAPRQQQQQQDYRGGPNSGNDNYYDSYGNDDDGRPGYYYGDHDHQYYFEDRPGAAPPGFDYDGDYDDPRRYHQQQRIVSYDTGGDSFAEPVEPPNLTVGRGNTGGGGMRRPQAQQQQHPGSYERNPRPNTETKSSFHAFTGDTSSSTYQSYNNNNNNIGHNIQARRIRPRRKNPANDKLSPDLTEGRTRHNGARIKISAPRETYGTASDELRSYGTGTNSFGERVGPTSSVGRGGRVRSPSPATSEGDGHMLDYYGPGTYSFSQHVGPGDLTTGRSQRR